MEHAFGNIYVRRMEDRAGFQPGHVIEGHAHNFDHLTIIFSGRWRARKWLPAVNSDGESVTVDGEPVWLLVQDIERDGPWHLLIEAKAKHEFTFLGNPVPSWMESYLENMPTEQADKFREEYNKSTGKGWCVYSHRTPQGDISQSATGWHAAYV
jgi:hypothetical protein